MQDLIGRTFSIAGMAIEIVADVGDQWQTRNLTTQDTVLFDKATLERAIRLGKAEEITDADETAHPAT